MSGIYIITNILNGHRYIGSSKNIETRWERHRKDLRCGVHHSPYLQRSWYKYGADNFTFAVLEVTDDLLVREQFWIDALNPEFNVNPVAGRPIGGNSPEALSKRTATRKRNGWYRDPQAAFENRSRAMKGRVFSEETREKMRLAKLGNKNRLGGNMVMAKGTPSR